MITMNTLPLSRRKFAQLLGAGAAAALVRPEFSFAKQPEHPPAVGDVVRLSANENAYGPSPKALKAMTDSFGIACRYPDEHNNVLIDKLAKLNGVNRDQVLLGDGSSEVLKLCAEAFSGKEGGSLVAADPTFEAILEQAKVNGAEVVKVPLTSSTYAHDLPRMLSSAKGGLIYVCNPNNPTASITPKDELRDFIAKTPAETMVLVDEAYFHFADSPDYESVIPLVNQYPNLLVARTFSKIYGMAGLRCGYCVAQKQTLDRMRATSDVGQRQYHGSGRGQCEFGRSRSGSKRPAVKQGSENIHHRRVGETGLQNHSLASQLHHVRLQAPCHAADPGNERAQGSRRPVVPSSSKPHASYDRQENGDGKFRHRVQASNRVTQTVVAAVVPTPSRRSVTADEANSAS